MQNRIIFIVLRLIIIQNIHAVTAAVELKVNVSYVLKIELLD